MWSNWTLQLMNIIFEGGMAEASVMVTSCVFRPGNDSENVFNLSFWAVTSISLLISGKENLRRHQHEHLQKNRWNHNGCCRFWSYRAAMKWQQPGWWTYPVTVNVFSRFPFEESLTVFVVCSSWNLWWLFPLHYLLFLLTTTFVTLSRKNNSNINV